MSDLSLLNITQVDSTAFGELAVQQPTVVALAHFPYNLNTDIVTTSTTGPGS